MKSLVCHWILASVVVRAQAVEWVKHEIVREGHCNTAVAMDVTRDGLADVIASFNGKVSLFVAPTWEREVVIHRFEGGVGACIHSAVLDADGDGDLDWAGAIANEHPFWLENPGGSEALSGAWTPRSLDPEITGIHCLLAADVDRDGRQDLIINNFEPAQGVADSIAWLSRPENPLRAAKWDRHVFANQDARGGSHYMGFGDVDGDGFGEIAVGAKGRPFADGNWFAFWKNPGSDGIGGAWSKVVLAEDQIGATNILPGDFNGDGAVDWFATRGHGVGAVWFENPSWTPREVDPDIREPHSLAVGDFDRDGDLDAATCGYGSEAVRWYENDGLGRFTIRTLDTQQQSYDLRSVDMDGDGDLDLLNAGRATGNVVWYENRGQ